jgi:hypothetical protein
LLCSPQTIDLLRSKWTRSPKRNTVTLQRIGKVEAEQPRRAASAFLP